MGQQFSIASNSGYVLDPDDTSSASYDSITGGAGDTIRIEVGFLGGIVDFDYTITGDTKTFDHLESDESTVKATSGALTGSGSITGWVMTDNEFIDVYGPGSVTITNLVFATGVQPRQTIITHNLDVPYFLLSDATETATVAAPSTVLSDWVVTSGSVSSNPSIEILSLVTGTFPFTLDTETDANDTMIRNGVVSDGTTYSANVRVTTNTGTSVSDTFQLDVVVTSVNQVVSAGKVGLTVPGGALYAYGLGPGTFDAVTLEPNSAVETDEVQWGAATGTTTFDGCSASGASITVVSDTDVEIPGTTANMGSRRLVLGPRSSLSGAGTISGTTYIRSSEKATVAQSVVISSSRARVKWEASGTGNLIGARVDLAR